MVRSSVLIMGADATAARIVHQSRQDRIAADVPRSQLARHVVGGAEHPDFVQVWEYIHSPENDGQAYKLLSRRVGAQPSQEAMVEAITEPTPAS